MLGNHLPLCSNDASLQGQAASLAILLACTGPLLIIYPFHREANPQVPGGLEHQAWYVNPVLLACLVKMCSSQHVCINKGQLIIHCFLQRSTHMSRFAARETEGGRFMQQLPRRDMRMQPSLRTPFTSSSSSIVTRTSSSKSETPRRTPSMAEYDAPRRPLCYVSLQKSDICLKTSEPAMSEDVVPPAGNLGNQGHRDGDKGA